MIKDKRAIIIFILFFVLYLSLLTENHYNVDGSTRALDYYWTKEVTLHPNSHILYPFNVYAWSNFLSIFGESKTPQNFIARVQILNALAASISLALSYLIFSKFLNRNLSLVLVFILGISNAFFLHAIDSAEAMFGFFLFVVSYITIYHKKNIYLILSAFLLAYAGMSYLSMLAGIPVILLSLYRIKEKLRPVVTYFLIFVAFFAIFYVSASIYKGETIQSLLTDNPFYDKTHSSLSFSNVLKLPLGLINAFLHMDFIYDLPTYTNSIVNLKINSLISIITGLIIALLFLFLINKNSIYSLKNIFTKPSVFTIALIYFLSSSFALIAISPFHNKLWIMGLHSFLFLMGSLYTKKSPIVLSLFAIGLILILSSNLHFIISTNNNLDCVGETVPLMQPGILLSTWNADFGNHFYSFYRNDQTKYYRIPNLAIEFNLDTQKVITFLKSEFCSDTSQKFYITSDVLMSRELWNTFLGDEMKMDFDLFHEKLIEPSIPISSCVSEIKPTC